VICIKEAPGQPRSAVFLPYCSGNCKLAATPPGGNWPLGSGTASVQD
jgi:hypothetical protein